MITWIEQKPDFVRRPLDDLIASLAFTKACAVVLTGGMPRVLVMESVMAGVLAHLRQQRVEMPPASPPHVNIARRLYIMRMRGGGRERAPST